MDQFEELRSLRKRLLEDLKTLKDTMAFRTKLDVAEIAFIKGQIQACTQVLHHIEEIVSKREV